jgi:peptidoglycan/LPS O-acetylase OafA/YrhL
VRTRNCYDEVRFILAFIVLVAHTTALASAEQLYWFAKYFDSNFAIKGFFAISGYLVTKSYLSSDSYIQYFEKRIRRIYPAYILTVIYCLFVGFVTTGLTFEDFVFNSLFVKYVVANIGFLNFLQPNLPGSIPNNVVPALNGSLWTIKVELMLYFTVPILLLMYRKIGSLATLVISFAFGISWLIYFSEFFSHSLGPSISRQFPGQLPFFALGSMLGFVKFNKPSAIIVIVVTVLYFVFLKDSFSQPYGEIVNMIIYPLFVIVVANIGKLSVGIGRLGDLSYGIYLFHFPTIQLLEHFGYYKSNPYIGFVLSIFVTITLAAFSWHLVEKRFLRSSSHYIKAEKIG